MTIAILYSLPTKRVKHSSYLAADEDTVRSAMTIASALRKKGATPLLIGLSEDRIKNTIQSIHADLIINLIDWTGIDLPLSLFAMEELEHRGIPFAGATKENFAFVDKITMKKALDRSAIPTPTWQLFRTGNEPVSSRLIYPVIVKLAHEHCSVGIEKNSFVKNRIELLAIVRDRIKRFGQEVYAEEFISGREFQITVLEKPHGPVMLPPAEIVYTSSRIPDFLTYSERWNENDPDFLRSNTALASLSKEQLRIFETLSKQTFRALGFRDFTRIDARLKGDHMLMILEANPNPGLDDDELYSMTISAKAAGLTFPDFLWEIVKSAIRRTRKG
jgi:D-alanine-D-alanine ligase